MVARRSHLHATFGVIASLLLILTVVTNDGTDIKSAPTIAKGYHIPSRIQADIALGYNNALSLLKWFDLINDFGDSERHHDFGDIAARLDTITRLNPDAEHAYYMAATVLPWGMRSTSLSRPLLDRAIENMPQNWRWPYFMGFNAYWFDHDLKRAALLMSQAARLPEAPPIVARLAARMQAQGGDLDTALAFLHSLLHNKQDRSFVEELTKQIKEVETEKVLRRIDRVIVRTPGWDRSKGLASLGIDLSKTLPDGGHITFDAKGVPVSSASGKRYRVYVPPHRQGQAQ